jgi:hypothetical protein
MERCHRKREITFCNFPGTNSRKEKKILFDELIRYIHEGFIQKVHVESLSFWENYIGNRLKIGINSKSKIF